jgi:hypothetical protein
MGEVPMVEVVTAEVATVEVAETLVMPLGRGIFALQFSPGDKTMQLLV